MDAKIGALSANEKWFTSDFVAPDMKRGQNDTHLHFSFGTSSTVEYTLDGGSKWVLAEDGKTFTAGTGYEIFVPIKPGDSLNFRATEEQTEGLDFGRLYWA